MADRREEGWRPPLFPPPAGGFGRLVAAARRFLDVQAGSGWSDLSAVLPGVRGIAVDVGCGAQPYRPLFHQSVTYIGIDTADAKAHFGYEVPDTRYYSGDRWPLDDASADFVLCTETLEHVPDPTAFLAEAARVTKPGGHLLLTVPFAARWHFIPYDYWRYTPSTLDRLLQAAGFTDVGVYARGNSVTVACYKSMALILPLLMPQGRPPALAWTLRLIALPLVPILIALAAIAQISLRGRGGDDCLGYTACATRDRGSAPRREAGL
jgi:SAM-dependent methyltransferase